MPIEERVPWKNDDDVGDTFLAMRPGVLLWLRALATWVSSISSVHSGSVKKTIFGRAESCL